MLMSQSFRRTLVWTIIAVLLLLGAMLQLKAAPAAGSLGGVEKQKSQQALVQAFTCTVSVLTFRLQEAETICGEAVELLPDSPLGYKYRGFTYLLEHRFERAEADFREAVRLDPRDPDIQAGLGQALNGQGQFDEAIDKFTAALAIAPREVRYISARCWARAGQGKDLSAALADCNLAINLSPHSAVAYNARGLVYLKKGQNLRAIRDYSTSLDLDKNQPSALFGRGLAEGRQYQFAAAKSDLALARKADPEIDNMYVLVGVLEEDCLVGGNACSLPKALRFAPDLKAPYLSVSYRHSTQH
jgi:tetratricopeptide (TPR) repeat protein